jgi:hypothetical protein
LIITGFYKEKLRRKSGVAKLDENAFPLFFNSQEITASLVWWSFINVRKSH